MYKKITLAFLLILLNLSFMFASSTAPNSVSNSNIINSMNTINAATNTITNTIISPPNSMINHSFHAFIESYIPNSIINYSPLINGTINGKNYTIMWLNASGRSFIIFNTTNSNYSFVLNSTSIKSILEPYLVAKYYPSNSTLNNLTVLMEEYRNDAQPPLSDCLLETGASNYQCSYSAGLINCLQNTCQVVPNCGGNPKRSVLSSFGASSPFAYGILNFSVQYGELNASYNKYFKLSNTINIKNFSQNIYLINKTLNNISILSSKIPDNPIFPTPTNLDPAQLGAQCAQYTANNGPWYCYAVGLCEYTSFNSAALSNIELLVSSLINSPISESSISSISNNSAKIAYSYYEPVMAERTQAQLSSMLNASSSSYSSALSKLRFLASHFNNASVSAALLNLTSTYNSILSKGINQNITAANAVLSSAIANSLKIYSEYGAPYISLYNLAQNSTSLITLQELNYQEVSSSIASLALLQSSLNSRLSSMLNASSIPPLKNSETIIYSNARSISVPFSMPEFVKKSALVMPLLSLVNAPINNKIATAPYLAAVLPLVLGLIIIFLIYYSTYYRLSKKNRIKKNPKVKRAWAILFAILFIIVLVWMYISIFYAESANSFLPISSFISNLNNSKNVYIIANSTIANPNYYSCISSLKSTLLSLGKTITLVNASNYSCTLGALKGSGCYSYLLNSGAPLIVVSNGNSSIVHKGLYGSVLYASGSAAEGPACILNNIIKIN